MSTIVLKELSYVRRPDRHIHGWLYAEFYMCVEWRTRYVNGRLWRNPIFARIFFKYLLAQTANFNSEMYDETRVGT